MRAAVGLVTERVRGRPSLLMKRLRQLAKHRSNEGRGQWVASGRMAAQHGRSTKTVLPVTVVWMSSWAPGVPESDRLYV